MRGRVVLTVAVTLVALSVGVPGSVLAVQDVGPDGQSTVSRLGESPSDSQPVRQAGQQSLLEEDEEAEEADDDEERGDEEDEGKGRDRGDDRGRSGDDNGERGDDAQDGNGDDEEAEDDDEDDDDEDDDEDRDQGDDRGDRQQETDDGGHDGDDGEEESEDDGDDDGEGRDGRDSTTTTRTATPTQTASPTQTSTQTTTAAETATAPVTPSPTSSPTTTAAPARLDITLATLSDTTITAGKSVRVAFVVENTGGRVGSFLAALVVDGSAVATERVTVAPGETETYVFERQFKDPGTYEIAVDGTSLGTLKVTAPPEAEAVTDQDGRNSVDSEVIKVVAATVPADWVKQGHEARVQVTVENAALRPAERLLTVTVDGEPVVTASVRLQPTERDTVTIEFDALEGTVAVEGVEAGRIDVSESRGSSEATPSASEWGAGLTPGIGITLVIAVVGTIAAVIRHETGG